MSAHLINPVFTHNTLTDFKIIQDKLLFSNNPSKKSEKMNVDQLTPILE